jgi:uncharacterized membrane protein YjjP (DUF1212 family)
MTEEPEASRLPADSDAFDPVRKRHRDLERIAHAALGVGCRLTEAGASVRVVNQAARRVVTAFDVEVIGLRSGYGSFEVTVAGGGNTITRMRQIGPHGVNHRLDFAIRNLVTRVAADRLDPGEVEAELARLVADTPRHPSWMVAIATGAACAAFGRLLGTDWPAFLPVFVAGGVGQRLRHHLLRRGVNVFVVAALIACLSAMLGGLGARLLRSTTVDLAMMASILLLVPGVAATNAQADIMDGFPTMGSARAVWVIMVMLFCAVGVWIAEALLGVG